ncbi:MAG: carbohydrate porin [Planctomycetota bacterium]
MDLVPGALLTLRTESRYGDSVNGDSGLLLPVSTDLGFPLTDPQDEDLLVAVTELNLLQFVSDRLGLFAGKAQTLDGDANEFASGRGRHQFQNFQLVASSVTAVTLLHRRPRGRWVWLPEPEVTVTSTVMSTADASTTTGFDELEEGLSWVTEGRLQYRLAELPGGMNLGGIWAFDGDFTRLRGKLQYTPASASAWSHGRAPGPCTGAPGSGCRPRTRPRTSSTSPTAEADLRGLGLFTRLGIADGDTNPVEWAGTVGIGGRGLIPGREEDSFGIGYFRNGLREPRTILAPSWPATARASRSTTSSASAVRSASPWTCSGPRARSRPSTMPSSSARGSTSACEPPGSSVLVHVRVGRLWESGSIPDLLAQGPASGADHAIDGEGEWSG